MATSRSDDIPGPWTAELRLFSGRRDPRWTVDTSRARRLRALWDELEPFGGTPQAPPPLGYRGIAATDPAGRRWDAYQGVVTLTWPGGREVRRDPPRAFERLVLETSPPGTLPEHVLELAGLT